VNPEGNDNSELYFIYKDKGKL